MSYDVQRSAAASALFQTPEGNGLYRQRLEELLHNVYRLEALTNLVAQLHARNRGAVAELGAGAARHYDNAVAEVRDRIVRRWMGVKNQLETEPRPLKFFARVAKLTDWHEHSDRAAARLDRADDSGKATLHIAALGNCTASWRAKVLLEGGSYRFEGLARCAHVTPTRDDQKGEGAGLRISGTAQPRANKLAGDSPWMRLDFEFEVASPLDSIELVCELRATQGEAWFDTDSLVLVRLK